jgi:GTP-binding protein LepA
VIYKVNLLDGSLQMVDNPAVLPDPQKRESIEEPYVKLEIYTPNTYNGALMELCQERRGEFIDMKYITPERVALHYEMPLAEVVTDFFDQMKSRTKGYASMEYHLIGYRRNDLVRLDVLINAERADPLTTIVHRNKAYAVGKGLVEKLKELIPRQQFKIPIQAAIGSRVIASESISAMRKDVLAKCYGGDISRKKKLLQKQAKGKKRMKSMGKVEVPQEAFMAVLKLNQ